MNWSWNKHYSNSVWIILSWLQIQRGSRNPSSDTVCNVAVKYYFIYYFQMMLLHTFTHLQWELLLQLVIFTLTFDSYSCQLYFTHEFWDTYKHQYFYSTAVQGQTLYFSYLTLICRCRISFSLNLFMSLNKTWTDSAEIWLMRHVKRTWNRLRHSWTFMLLSAQHFKYFLIVPQIMMIIEITCTCVVVLFDLELVTYTNTSTY